MAAAEISCVRSEIVEVVRRYSRQPHLWRTSKRLLKLLTEANVARRTERVRPVPHVHKLGQRLCEEQVQQLVKDYQAGATSTELRASYSLGKGSVLKLLREGGVEMRRQGLSESQVALVVERYRAGLTIREVAAELGLAKTTVQDGLRRSASNGGYRNPTNR